MISAEKQDKRRPMDELSAPWKTKSDKIRALDKEGYSRSEIAKFLGIRYQHVRNVLVGDAAKKNEKISNQICVSVGPGGRIVVPAPYRKAMGIHEGEQVMLRLVGEEVHIGSKAMEIRRAQELVAKHVPSNVSLVDELLSERRSEADKED